MEQMFLVHGATGHALKVDNNATKVAHSDVTLTQH
jgi:hypothetical protein